jgi:hypothetical protein
MKLTTYQCDHCERKFSNDKELIAIGVDGGDDNDMDSPKLYYVNPHCKMNQVKEMNRMHDLHFCSQDCFINHFFDTENKGTYVANKHQ